MPTSVAIVGGGLAGATAAFTLREEGYHGRITLIGEEYDLPYDRPPLSKDYLMGKSDAEAIQLRPEATYAQLEIDLRLGRRGVGIDLHDRAVLLEDGERCAAEAMLIATGARNRQPPIPGLDLAGVHQLRSRADADALRAGLAPGHRVLVAGLGFIGCEVAAALRSLGAEVIGVELTATPLERVLGSVVGAVVAELHEEHGIELVLGESITAFEGRDRIKGVRTASGRLIACDVVVAGFGVRPNVELVQDTAIAVDDGIIVDEFCRTSVPGVFAVGDVAKAHHPQLGERVRVEHWRNAMEQGAVAARAILGSERPSHEPHWFWSDQYDTNIQYLGHHRELDEIVIRGDLAERRFIAFYLKGRVVQAAVAFNNARELRRARPLLMSRRPVDVSALRSERNDLRALVA